MPPSENSSPRKTPKSIRVPGASSIVKKTLPGFSRQLAAMLSSGIPIVGALEAQQEQTDNKNFKMVIARMRASIENGAAFSEALRQFPTVFDDLYCNMVRGGESGGQLAETISRLASFLESSAKLRRKITSAMAYPVVILCLSLVIAVAMIIFIVPVFADMFSEFGGELPAPTRALVALSNLLAKRGWIVLIVLAVGIFFLRKWARTPSGTFTIDSLKLRLPVFGELIRKLIATRFARTLGELIACGVPILSALEITSGATGNSVAKKIILEARNDVESGEPLSSGLMKQSILPLALVRMLQAGEKTGRIDEMMVNVADFYDDEIDATLSGLTSLLEPLLMVFLGLIIGSIVLSMFLPIFKLSTLVMS